MKRVLSVAGYATCVQLIAGITITAIGRPIVAWVIFAGFVAFLVHSVRSRFLLAGMPILARSLTIALWQFPGLVFGAYNLVYFFGWADAFDLGCFVLQGWYAIFLPVLATFPGGDWNGIAMYLWATSALPFLLAITLLLTAGICRGVIAQADSLARDAGGLTTCRD